MSHCEPSDRAILREIDKKRVKSRKEQALEEQGFVSKERSVYMHPSIDESAGARRRMIAQTLTDANFADPVARELWQTLPENTRFSALVDFQCVSCLLQKTQGLTADDMENMTSRQIEEATGKALEMRKGPDGARYDNVTQIDDILIAFDKNAAPGALPGMNALQIRGTCKRCGASLTRTLSGEAFSVLYAMSGLLRDAVGSRNSKTGRNDPCPCGSGKKYKHCCGRNETPSIRIADGRQGAQAHRALGGIEAGTDGDEHYEAPSGQRKRGGDDGGAAALAGEKRG